LPLPALPLKLQHMRAQSQARVVTEWWLPFKVLHSTRYHTDTPEVIQIISGCKSRTSVKKAAYEESFSTGIIILGDSSASYMGQNPLN